MNDVQKRAIQEKVRTIGKVVLAKKMKELPEILAEALEGCLPKLVGMEKNSWNHNWKIDHCNGRESLISDLLTKKVRKDAEEWVKKQSWPELTPTMIKAIKKEYQVEVRRSISEKLRDAAHQKAQEYVDTLVEEAVVKFTREIE